MTLDETHGPELRSWVESANDPSTDFPIQNLPFGVFRHSGSNELARVGVAIGDQILDVAACQENGLLSSDVAQSAMRCAEPALNALMEMGASARRQLRRALSELLRTDSPVATRSSSLTTRVLTSMRDAELLLPARIGDYTDFYASIDHARNIGSMFRPDNPLLPNDKWVP